MLATMRPTGERPGPAGGSTAALGRRWLVWALSRTFVLGVTLGWFDGDTGTYFAHGRAWWQGQLPYLAHAVEYPTGATLLFTALAAPVRTYPQFRELFVLVCLLVDACVFHLVDRIADESRPASAPPAWAPAVVYALASAPLYPVLLVRFDLFPTAAVLAATRALARPGTLPPARAARAGMWLGVGVALKLYPLLFFPLLALAALRPRRQVASFAALAAAAALVVAASFLPFLAAGAGASVLSFLQYQGERGLQIESTWASALLLLARLTPLDVHHAASHHAHDVVGRAAALLTSVSRVVHPLALLAVTALAHVRRLPLPRAFAALCATTLATASMLSPQFLLWLLPLAALAFAGADTFERRGSILLVAIALLTTLVFPVLYDALLAERLVAILPLFLRNAALVALALRLCRPPA